MRISLILLISLYLQIGTFAQKQKWGKISIEELQYKECSYDKDADAVVLYEAGELDLIDYTVGAELKVHIRIKILSDNALSYGNIRIPYYIKNSYEQVKDIKAHTINSEDGFRSEIYPVKKEDIFKVKVDKEHEEVKFTFPKVKKGSILEYQYTILTKNIDGSRAWNFQNRIPTLYSRLEAKIASSFKYNVTYQGTLLTRRYQGKQKESILKNDIYYWSLRNVPAIKEEDYAPFPQQYIEQLRLKMIGYYVNTRASNSYENAKLDYKEIGKPIPVLAHDLFTKDEKISRYFKNNKIYKDILKTVIKDNDALKTKFLKIYNYVKTTFRSNDDSGVYVEQVPNKLFNTKKGSISEINLFFIGLLRQAKLSAYPILSSTRNYITVRQDARSLRQFNQIISKVVVNNEAYEIDISKDKYSYNLLNEDSFGNLAYIYKGKDKGNWVILGPKQIVKTQTYYRTKISEKGVSYDINISFADYESIRKRRRLAKVADETKFIQGLLIDKENTNIKIQDAEVKNKKAYDKKLIISAKAISSEPSTEEDIIYLDFFKFQTYREALLKGGQRWLPIDFAYPFLDTYIVNLDIPKGYKILDIPQKFELNILDNSCKFSYIPNQVGNSFQIVVKIIVRQSFFDLEQYPKLKVFFETISSKLAEPIVLKKD